MRYPRLNELIQRRMHEMSLRDKHDWTLREIAGQMGEAENSVYRWAKGLTIPESAAAREKLAKIFGPETWAAMGMLPPDIDPAFLRLYLGAKSDPNLARILADAMEKAQEYQSKQPQGQLSFV
jgi:transcriptional regulator with XRE-family HTH domain